MLQAYLQAGRIEAGCDEAGRGCLAGPVYAAAVILPEAFDPPLLNDSKKIPEATRDELRRVIEAEATAWAVAAVSPEEIDRINILNASFLAMNRAVRKLKVRPEFLLIDGHRFKTDDQIPFSCEVKGDSRFRSIAAASILAKTWRDEHMRELDSRYPGYDWCSNKGYPTAAHRRAIEQLGASPVHRRSFRLLADGKQARLF